jgi:cytidine deaminase
MNEKDILNLLEETKKKALAIYSKFHVSALLVTKDEKVFSGINIESSSYGLTICAERVALFKALSEGHRKFDRIYIMSDLKKPCPPCGACRQVLMDFAPNINVIMYSSNGYKQEELLRNLMPLAFQGLDLKK